MFSHLITASRYPEDPLTGGALTSALVFRIHQLDKVHPCLPHNPLLQIRPGVELRSVLQGTSKIGQRSTADKPSADRHDQHPTDCVGPPCPRRRMCTPTRLPKEHAFISMPKLKHKCSQTGVSKQTKHGMIKERFRREEQRQVQNQQADGRTGLHLQRHHQLLGNPWSNRLRRWGRRGGRRGGARRPAHHS